MQNWLIKTLQVEREKTPGSRKKNVFNHEAMNKSLNKQKVHMLQLLQSCYAQIQSSRLLCS